MKTFFILISMIAGSFSQFSGGWSNQNPNVLQADLSKFFLSAVAEKVMQNPVQTWNLKKVLKYQTQVVAGTNHEIVAQITDAGGLIKIVRLKIFESLPVYGKKFELTTSRVFHLNESSATDVLADKEQITKLTNAIVKSHEYNAQKKVRFHIKKFNYAFEFGSEGLYLVNYVIEGTNNEVSLYEHLLSEGNRWGYESLYAAKLNIGAVGKSNKWSLTNLISDECNQIVSYLVCLKNEARCSAEKFVEELECKNLPV